MTKITLGRVLVALLIVLVLAAASVILIKNNAGSGAARADALAGLLH